MNLIDAFINPLNSPGIVHTPTYVITLSGSVDYVRRAQRVNIYYYVEKIIIITKNIKK